MGGPGHGWVCISFTLLNTENQRDAADWGYQLPNCPAPDLIRKHTAASHTTPIYTIVLLGAHLHPPATLR